MARPRREQSDPRVQKEWIKEGRGAGRNGDYQTWLRMQDLSSRGKSRRLTSHITGDRIVHLLSNHEALAFFIFEWSPSVVDIREQYPLLPLEETIEIARDLGVDHPTDPQTGLPIVMTTDLLITTQEGGVEKHCACAIKEVKDLGSWRHREKLEIARRYHEKRGHAWMLTTERDIPPELARNLEILREKRDLDQWGGVSVATRAVVEKVLLPAIWKGSESLTAVAAAADQQLGLSPGTSLSVAYHLIYHRKWIVGLKQLLNPGEPLDLINPRPKETNEVLVELPRTMA